MRRISMFILCLVLTLTSSLSVFASDTGVQDAINAGPVTPNADYYVWRIDEVLQDYTTSYDPYEFFYEGAPAESSGEVDTITIDREVSHTFSGSIAAGLKRSIEIELGYVFDDSVTLSASKQSRTLNEGEYVRGYWRPIYSQSKVVQGEYHHLDGYEIPTGVTKTCYGKEAKGIGLKLEYYTASGLKVNTEYLQIFKE